jgi:GH35 family endo-1,4-beta-xylanase
MANKEVRKLVKRLKAKGVKVKNTKKSHICVMTPGGMVYCSSTPSDNKAVRNMVAMLRRKGVAL